MNTVRQECESDRSASVMVMCRNLLSMAHAFPQHQPLQDAAHGVMGIIDDWHGGEPSLGLMHRLAEIRMHCGAWPC